MIRQALVASPSLGIEPIITSQALLSPLSHSLLSRKAEMGGHWVLGNFFCFGMWTVVLCVLNYTFFFFF